MKWVTVRSIHYISIQVWLHMWGVNVRTDIVKVLNIDLWADLTAKKGQSMVYEGIFMSKRFACVW